MTDKPRVWFVTGASTGLGRGLAQAIVDEGDRLVATARDRGAVAESRLRWTRHGGSSGALTSL
jgi:NAD(P)-dependent dehydrogenase (short-subunit alcohol dehydrogenase family)